MRGKTRLPYPPEFREKIIELVRSGRTPAELAEDFEPSEQTIRNWVKPTWTWGDARTA
jgi:transposase